MPPTTPPKPVAAKDPSAALRDPDRKEEMTLDFAVLKKVLVDIGAH